MIIHKPEVKSSRHHVGRPQAQGYTRDQQVSAACQCDRRRLRPYPWLLGVLASALASDLVSAPASVLAFALAPACSCVSSCV